MLFQTTQTMHKFATVTRPSLCSTPELSRVCRLTAEEAREVKAFLAVRPVHTVAMASFINDNGMISDLNRGEFFGFRDTAGNLEGVALIGHSTLVEARTDVALKALAFAARSSKTPIHLIRSGGTAARTFWNYLDGFQNEPRMECEELLFEVRFPFPVQECGYDLRPACPEELEAVALAQAEIAEIECGVNPMVKDREGFMARVSRRIAQGRVFVVFDGDELIFKADVVAQTEDVAYLEGIYVAPDPRGAGTGSACLSKLCLERLANVNNACLLSKTEFTGAHRTFLKAGMRITDAWTTLFV